LLGGAGAGRPQVGGPGPGQVVGVDRHRTGDLGEAHEAKGDAAFATGPRRVHVAGDVAVVVLDLGAVGDHRATTVPPAPTDDVEGGGAHRVGGAYDGADVEVVLPVLDRHVETVPPGREVGDDRLVAPVAVAVLDVAPVPFAQQIGVQPRVPRPVTPPRADALVRLL